ncbi:MAG: AraC family transcriptional regulator [Pseudomonadota bacterium]
MTDQSGRLGSSPVVRGGDIADLIVAGERHGIFEMDEKSTTITDRFSQFRGKTRDTYSEVGAANSFILILAMDSDGQVRAEYDGQPFDDQVRTGTMNFVPVNVAQSYDFRGRTTNILTSLQPALFDLIRDQNPELANVTLDEPWSSFVQPRISRLILEQNRLVRSGDMGWRSLSDANMVQLAVELMCLSANRHVTSAKPLSPGEVASVEAYVRANLESNVTLDEVSALSGRPLFGFCRAFKAAKGESFHRFAMGVRLDEARRLLTETETPLVEVAYATGFSSQSHLTSTMNRKLGITPGRLRARTRRG